MCCQIKVDVFQSPSYLIDPPSLGNMHTLWPMFLEDSSVDCLSFFLSDVEPQSAPLCWAVVLGEASEGPERGGVAPGGCWQRAEAVGERELASRRDWLENTGLSGAFLEPSATPLGPWEKLLPEFLTSAPHRGCCWHPPGPEQGERGRASKGNNGLSSLLGPVVSYSSTSSTGFSELLSGSIPVPG